MTLHSDGALLWAHSWTLEGSTEVYGIHNMRYSNSDLHVVMASYLMTIKPQDQPWTSVTAFADDDRPVARKHTPLSQLLVTSQYYSTILQWGSLSASDPRAKNTGQHATKGTVLTSQSLSPWCDCRRWGSMLASWRWQDINVGNPLWRRALLYMVYIYL